MTIRSVAVMGAGTMGAQIAAHFANAGVPVLLLDLTADVARQGLKRARALKPDPFFTPDVASLITVPRDCTASTLRLSRSTPLGQQHRGRRRDVQAVDRATAGNGQTHVA